MGYLGNWLNKCLPSLPFAMCGPFVSAADDDNDDDDDAPDIRYLNNYPLCSTVCMCGSIVIALLIDDLQTHQSGATTYVPLMRFGV